MKRSAEKDASRQRILKPKKWPGTGGEVHSIPIDTVTVPEDFPAPDDTLVADIAQSISVCGLIHPIPVRREKGDFGRLVLIDGVARLAAYKLLDENWVPCTYFEDDAVAAQYARYAANLFRKNLTALEEAELVAGFIEFINEQQNSLLWT